MKNNPTKLQLSAAIFVLTVLGFWLIFSSLSDLQKQTFLSEISENWKAVLGTILLFSALFLVGKIFHPFSVFIESVFPFSKIAELNFSDVDLKNDNKNQVDTHRINGDVIINNSSTITLDEIKDMVKSEITACQLQSSDTLNSFESYFNGLRITLEEKSSIADQKASILLDKGTSYSRWGIGFFLFSIISWQFLSWLIGFKSQFIYGMVSCSILFIFIEFLSAWFLKQYRHFIDTSTYLIKVKSIFDKYMLSYLIMKEIPEEEKNKRIYEMLDILNEEIKWPESYLMKSGDVSFAKETLEALTYIAKTLKEQAKSGGKIQSSLD